MIKCQACGTQNLDGSQYCDECGDSLNKYQAPGARNEAVNSNEIPDASETEPPIFQSAGATPAGIPQVVENPPETEFADDVSDARKTSVSSQANKISASIHANLVIERGNDIGKKFPLAAEESNIGRWDADNGIFPDVDLDSHDPEAKVSRKHARIHYRKGEHLLEDLGSTNGTFVNRGRRLLPGTPQKLNDGDEIIVGKTFLRFRKT